MLLADLLADYPDAALDRIASDKVEEVVGLRLPRAVVIREVCSALSSMSYVARALAPARPPTYTILQLLLGAQGYRRPMDAFKEEVGRQGDAHTERALVLEATTDGKNYRLYLRMLQAAWENDGQIDRSEAQLLEVLRKELGIWVREHLILEHHPAVRGHWEAGKAFETARNQLLSSGILITNQGDYVLAEEVARQVRRVWDIDLDDDAYTRLLDRLTAVQLRRLLELNGLALSGTKEQRTARLVKGFHPPAEVLNLLGIDELKEVARGCSLPVSQPKAQLVEALIAHFDTRADIAPAEVPEPPEAPPPAEPRTLDDEALGWLLQHLATDQLQDVLATLGLRKSGSRADRLNRLRESGVSERVILRALPKLDLATLCRRLQLRPAGVKDDLVERVIELARGALREPAPDIGAPPVGERAAVPAPTSGAPPPRDAKPALEQPPGPTSPLPDPRGLRDATADFPTLDLAGQVVVALLREARSLNELELERATRQHGLGWFLVKAHMSALAERVGQGAAGQIQIRSAGGMNLYDWVDANDRRGGLDKRAARDVVDALRQGVVPERHLDLLVVGQDTGRQHLLDLMEHVADGRSEFKFIRGAYGAGKTFVCSWLREQALERGFLTSTVRIGPDQPLSDLPVLYSGVVRGLRARYNREQSALPDVMERWLLDLHLRVARTWKVAPFSEVGRTAIEGVVGTRIGEELTRAGSGEASFASAARHYYSARIQGDAETAQIAMNWLQGGANLAADAQRRIGVRGQLEPAEVFPRLRALLHMARGGGARGLVLFVDELELVRKFPHARQREQAYETLRLLIDEAGENGLPGCLMICTGTDALFDDTRYGLGSYEALHKRVAAPAGPAPRSSVRQPVLQLEPLDASRLEQVARRVREVHAAAYGWEPAERVTDEVLMSLVRRATAFGDGHVSRLPRPFLRELVNILDLCEENPSVGAADLLGAPISTADVANGLADLLGDA